LTRCLFSDSFGSGRVKLVIASFQKRERWAL
jgi:hypothetical protein